MMAVAVVLLLVGLALFHVGLETSGWEGFAFSVTAGLSLAGFVIVVMSS